MSPLNKFLNYSVGFSRRWKGKAEGRRQEAGGKGRRQEAGGGRERRIITLLQPIDRSYIAAALTLRTDQTAETT
jgi:hypothetical protein